MQTEIDYGKIVGYCDICESPMYENSAHCLHCGEVPCYLICETCWGTGEIPDNNYMPDNPNLINRPYKTCPDCGGSRKKEDW
jgi:hypothetical protein